MSTLELATARSRSRLARSCPRRPTRVPTEEDLCGWLATAMPGDAAIYHRGQLVVDRSPSISRLTDADRARLAALAGRVMTAAKAGRVHLIQRRHGEDDYTYCLIARACPKHRPGRLAGAQPRRAA